VRRRLQAEGPTASDRAAIATKTRRQAEAKCVEERTRALLAAQTRAATPEGRAIAETTLAALRGSLRNRTSHHGASAPSEFTDSSKRKSR
jgi:hypothetical protein